MRFITSKKSWLIGIIVLFFSLSIFSSVADYQKNQYNTNYNFNYQLATNIINEAFISKEQCPSYLAFFIKPFKLFNNIKYLYLADFKTINSKFISTLNLNASIIVIILFAMFYQLSRTSSEKLGLLIKT